MKITLLGEDYDLTFQRRISTFATLRKSGEVVAKAAAILNPSDTDSPYQGRVEALRNLTSGKGSTPTWTKEHAKSIRLQHFQGERRKRERYVALVDRIYAETIRRLDAQGASFGPGRYSGSTRPTRTQPASSNRVPGAFGKSSGRHDCGIWPIGGIPSGV